MSPEDIVAVTERWNQIQGRSYGLNDINNEIWESMKRKIESAGFMSDNIPGKFNKTTLNNYHVEFAMQKKYCNLPYQKQTLMLLLKTPSVEQSQM